MDYIKYLNDLIGKKTVDTDGVYGVQCVDLVKRMLKDYLGIKNIPPLGDGKFVAENLAEKYPQYFKFIAYSMDFEVQAGDVISFESSSSPKSGHVGIAISSGKTYDFIEQWNKSGDIRKNTKTVKQREYAKSYTIVGVARPIYAENGTPETETQDVVAKIPGKETEISQINTENSQEVIYKIGNKVRVKKGAKTYDGKGLADFVYTTTYSVLQVGTKGKPDYIVFGLNGQVTAAVHVEDLIKV